MNRNSLKDKMLKSGIDEHSWNTQFEPNLETLYTIAMELISRLPSIGFMSKTKRLNAIYVIFEHIDRLIDDGLSFDDALCSYLIARQLSANFDKAHIMFVLESPKMGIGYIPTCPVAEFIWQQATGRV